MNNVFKKIIQFKLKWLAKIYLWRIKPYVFIVAGTTNRHWIKEAIIEALKEKGFNARGSKKNFNAEIGLPLSILDLPSGEGSIIGWLSIILQAIKKILTTNYQLLTTNYLVLETAISRPDDMNYLLSIVKPNAVALTTITMIYEENFEDLDKIVLEYQKLVKALPKDGLLFFNFDDERIKSLAKFTLCKTLAYGLSDGADYWAKNIKKYSRGLKFDICINMEDNMLRNASLFKQKENNIRCESISIERFGKHHIYAKIMAYAIHSEKF